MTRRRSSPGTVPWPPRASSSPWGTGRESRRPVSSRCKARIGRAGGYVRGGWRVADGAGEVPAWPSLRSTLTARFTERAGHIGTGVLPQHRRRGYATEILRQSLIIARAAGVDRVLVICDQDNIGSRAVIESCGGVLDPVVPGASGTAVLRFWID